MQNPNKKEPKKSNNSQLGKQHFDSETYANSKNDINSSSQTNDIPNEKILKKSIDLFPKKIYMEELDKSLKVNRKYTAENQLIIKDFVPQLKPIVIHVVPSKLRLNKKGIKDLKRNKNRILLNSNKYYISCPSSEEEDDSDKYISSKEILPLCNNKNDNNNNNNVLIFEENNDISINKIRKNLQKTKNGNMPKIRSKNDIVVKGKYDKDLNLDYSSESDLYDIDEINNYSLLEYDKEDKEDKEDEKNIETVNKNENNNIGRSRTHSFTILEMLQKNYKLDA